MIQVPCIYCGHQAEHVDHIVPRSASGSDDRSNLAPACKSCNSSKGARPVEYFLRAHAQTLARVRALQRGEDVLRDLKPGEKPRAEPLDRIAITVRLPKADWVRLRNLVMTQGVSTQALATRGLSAVLAKHGLPPVAE